MSRGAWAALVGVVAFGSVPSSGQAQRRAHAPRGEAPSRETRWYGAEPHVPLARVAVDAGERWLSPSGGISLGIESAPHRACGAWAHVGTAWAAVDRWGQIVRPSRLTERNYYDSTRCHEVGFDADARVPPGQSYNDWRPGRVVLYARGGFHPRASLRWSPSAAERADHERFVVSLTSMFLANPGEHVRSANGGNRGAAPLPFADRTLFFHFTDPQSHAERRLAVSGGSLLVVAERTAEGRWFVVHVDHRLSRTATNPMPYLPVAVFDMNDDGRPEIVYHDRESGGEFFGDAVLSLDPMDEWHEAARSVGGSTA
jgi:hypothetical protein